MAYTLDHVNEILEALNHSGNLDVIATISNVDFQKHEGSVGVQISFSIDQNHNYNKNPSTNIEEQPQVFPHNHVHVTLASGHELSTNGNYTGKRLSKQ